MHRENVNKFQFSEDNYTILTTSPVWYLYVHYHQHHSAHCHHHHEWRLGWCLRDWGWILTLELMLGLRFLLGMAWRVLVDLSSCSAIFHQKVCKMSILQTLFTDIQNPYPEEILTQMSLKTKKSVNRDFIIIVF